VLGNKTTKGLSVATTPVYVTRPCTAIVPLFRVNEASVIESGSIASLNVANKLELNPASVARFTGKVEITMGAVPSGAEPVVKVQA